MSNIPQSQLLAIIVSIVVFLTACGREATVEVIDVSLIRQPETFIRESDIVTAVGLLKATIETDFDVVEYAKVKERNLSYTVSACESGIELDGWSKFYDVASRQTGIYRYAVLFNYKSLPRNAQKYNLAIRPEPLCFTVGIASMNVFTASRSNTVRYELSETLKQELLSYEQRGDPVKFERESKSE